MKHIAKVYYQGQVIENKANDGQNLLSFLNKNSYKIKAPCDGKGTCGKCKVLVDGLRDIKESEKSKLGKRDLENGYRLACYNKIHSDITLYLDGEKDVETKISTSPSYRKILKKFKKLKKTDTYVLLDQKRLMKYAKKKDLTVSLDVLRELPLILRYKDFEVTLCLKDNGIIAVESHNTKDDMKID